MKRMRGSRKLSIGAVFLAVAVGLTAFGSCSRTMHMRSDYGARTHEFFHRQARAAEDGGSRGLDSEEAAQINESYRRSMGQPGRPPRGDASSSVLILEDRGYETRQRQRE